MLRTTAVLIALAAVGLASPADAQWRSNGRSRQDTARAQGVPPGQLPPAGMCRVWYNDLPPGQQPSPMNCREAEIIASRSRNARVIYGDDRYGTYGNDRYGRYPDDYGVRRPGSNRAPNGSRDPYYYPGARGGYMSQAFDTGYRDGLQKGREDSRDNDRYDPARHKTYRSADHGYKKEYGTKAQYQTVYRDGFRAGYDEAYRGTRNNTWRTSPYPY